MRSRFADGEELYHATLDQILEVINNEQRAEDIFEVLQRMKGDPKYCKKSDPNE